jgi:hypothetical protein
MYRRHFALCSWPFGPEIAPDEMFTSTGRAELNVRLEHLVEMSGIGLVTGGKPRALRAARAWARPNGLHRDVTRDGPRPITSVEAVEPTAHRFTMASGKQHRHRG